jgi:hypothetical protein
VLTYGGFSPNEELQINLASYGPPFYPPDPFMIIGNRIEVEMDQDGTMFTLGIDFASTSGELLDPDTILTFVPSPAPPDGSIYGFNPQPEPPAIGEALALFIRLGGGAGAAGSTQISLTIEVLDDNQISLPLFLVAQSVPAMSGLGQAVVVSCLIAVAMLGRPGRTAASR